MTRFLQKKILRLIDFSHYQEQTAPKSLLKEPPNDFLQPRTVNYAPFSANIVVEEAQWGVDHAPPVVYN